MKQAPFEASHAAEWEAFEAFLENKKSFDPAEMPTRFRRVCQALALAAQRCYSADLVDRLNRLALRGHHALYANRRRESQAVLDFIIAGFPRLGMREADTSLMMFGFYIWNNVRIGFQTFAGGMLAGVATAWFLASNG